MKITTCSTSLMVPVRTSLGLASTARRFGGSAANAAAPAAVFRNVRRSVMSSPRMEEIENLLGQSFAHARDRSQIAHARTRNRTGRAEVLEQGAFAARAYARDLVERIGADGL